MKHTCAAVGDEERPQRVCLKVQVCDSLKLNKLRRQTSRAQRQVRGLFQTHTSKPSCSTVSLLKLRLCSAPVKLPIECLMIRCMLAAFLCRWMKPLIVTKEWLLCRQAPGRATAEELFTITDCETWGLCGDVQTGARRLGNEEGCKWMHCMIHAGVYTAQSWAEWCNDWLHRHSHYIKIQPLFFGTETKQAPPTQPFCITAVMQKDLGTTGIEWLEPRTWKCPVMWG